MAIRGVTGLLFKGKVRKAASLASRKVKRTFGLGRYKVLGARQATSQLGAATRLKGSPIKNKARITAAITKTQKSKRRARAGAVLGTVGVAGVGTAALAVRRKRKKV